MCLHIITHHFSRLGHSGKDKDSFMMPLTLQIDENTGNIAVADNSNNSVQLFNSEGKHLNTVSHKEIINPTSVAFTSSSNLIVIVK